MWGTAKGSFWSGNWIEWPKASNALLGGEQEAKIRGKTKAKTTYARIIRDQIIFLTKGCCIPPLRSNLMYDGAMETSRSI